MKIYSMTATFGKLENKTLELKPGLNIIQAPNEWGKSTWCAFLIAMLYGIDTKARTTQTALADKDHYLPWSGAPMEGRMDICWDGRNITIERRSKGRIPMGEFRAYETETGLEVPELTAANCGMVLLGVERSVFVRAGFLKLSDMPVTQDDALRRRLNNLVTTGDESDDGDKLAQTLKDLKNKCKHNRTGLLPQAEEERDELVKKLEDIQELNIQAERIKNRQKELEQWIKQLENHRVALKYAQAQEDTRHIREAEAEHGRLQAELAALEEACAALPSESEAEQTRLELQRLHSESMSLQMEQQLLPPAPEKPTTHKCFMGLSGEEAVQQAGADVQQAKTLKKKSPLTMIGVGVLIAGALALVAGIALQVMFIVGGALLVAGAVLLAVGINKTKNASAQLRALELKYATEMPELWLSMAEGYGKSLRDYEKALESHRQMAEELRGRTEILVNKMQTLTGGEPVGVCLEKWEQISNKWKTLADLRRDIRHMEGQAETLRAMTKELIAPSAPDTLTQTLSETDTLLRNASDEQRQNQLRLGQFQGKIESMGQESALRNQLKQVRSRIEKLENTYAALELALQAIGMAKSELQRRFAPRIAKRAQELFSALTDGRYEKVMLGDDLSIHTGTQEETTLRPSQWRSDGTVDQLYLALRLAVAEELTPDAPLVLDDAMVRFDDDRLATALHILAEMAENKQVILFTCQQREKKVQGEV